MLLSVSIIWIVSQPGILCGICWFGNYVILAGQVGIVGHLEIGDGAVVTAQSGVSRSAGVVGEQVFGFRGPAWCCTVSAETTYHVQRVDKYVEGIKASKRAVAEECGAK